MTMGFSWGAEMKLNVIPQLLLLTALIVLLAGCSESTPTPTAIPRQAMSVSGSSIDTGAT